VRAGEEIKVLPSRARGEGVLEGACGVPEGEVGGQRRESEGRGRGGANKGGQRNGHPMAGPMRGEASEGGPYAAAGRGGEGAAMTTFVRGWRLMRWGTDIAFLRCCGCPKTDGAGSGQWRGGLGGGERGGRCRLEISGVLLRGCAFVAGANVVSCPRANRVWAVGA